MKYGLWKDEFQGLELPKAGGSRISGLALYALGALVGLIFWAAFFGVAWGV